MRGGKQLVKVVGAALLLGSLALPAAAQDSPDTVAETTPLGAAQFVETLGNEAAALLASANGPARQKALKSLIRRGFNLELTSQFVLGQQWNRATPEQRAEFQDLFTEYLLNSYARHLSTFKPETLSVVASHPVGERDVLVETVMASTDGEANPVWRVRAQDGTYRIIDVSVDGVSLALTQRREFAAVVSRRGLDGLLDLLREKLAAQSQAAELQPARDQSHASLLVSILASPNVSRLGLLLAQR